MSVPSRVLKLCDTLCLVIGLNTALGYRRVCTHAVALYVFFWGGGMLLNSSFEHVTKFLCLPFVVICFLCHLKEK